MLNNHCCVIHCYVHHFFMTELTSMHLYVYALITGAQMQTHTYTHIDFNTETPPPPPPIQNSFFSEAFPTANVPMSSEREKD